jgi:hypothetical protein
VRTKAAIAAAAAKTKNLFSLLDKLLASKGRGEHESKALERRVEPEP